MTSYEYLAAVIDALNSENIPHMVVGSFSSNFYGIERSTRDADIVVKAEDRFILRVADRPGPAFRLDEQMSFAVLSQSVAKRSIGNTSIVGVEFTKPDKLDEIRRTIPHIGSGECAEATAKPG